MQSLSVQDAEAWLKRHQGLTLYVHLEVNPQGYIRNAKVAFRAGHIKGAGPYRVYLTWDDPEGMVQLNEITDFYEENACLICTAYDTQSRIAQSVVLSPVPLSM
ncbi:DUF1806 family protein [Alicyclobacillus fodiniaquatilis]|uniref:DUF1806 family protein n=1 Tax=Alicyclobacillus fodiniaquatilis TaxID=1661150 RepID=A0ABW4JDF8_9BACL